MTERLQLLIEEADSRYGKMFMFKQDEVISRSLRLYGEWAAHELSVLEKFIRPGTTVIDVGANIGTHTMAFAGMSEDVDVIAIEAHPLTFSVLQMNCLINGLNNVFCNHMLVGNQRGVVNLPSQIMDWQNVGANSFVDVTTNQKDVEEQSWPVVMENLNSLNLNKPISLIKIDVEGMELNVIRGAVSLIKNHRPIILAEQLDVISLKSLYRTLSRLKYQLFWLETHPFNINNYRGEAENVWWRTEMGVLCIPKEVDSFLDLPRVTTLETCVPHRLNAREGIAV